MSAIAGQTAEPNWLTFFVGTLEKFHGQHRAIQLLFFNTRSSYLEDYRIEEIEKPVPGPGEVLVKVCLSCKNTKGKE